MAKIICPNCGEVSQYYLTEHVRRGLIYDINGNPQGQTEDEVFYVGKSYRCLNCGSKVRIELRGNTEEHDCEHCNRTYGTLGCCSTVSNKWIYSCEEGQREYEEIHKEVQDGNG